MSDIQDDLLREHIFATEALIITSGRMITTIRPTFVSDGAGGRGKIEEVVQPSKRRFFGAVVQDAIPVQQSAGDMVVQRYVLVGMPDDDIKKEDFFVIGPTRYDVEWIDQATREYQCKAICKAVS